MSERQRRTPRVIAILAAYNEEDVIGQVIADLIAQGVDVYFIDHGSTDGTLAEARPFVGRGVIAIEEMPNEGFAWEALLRRKEELARELDGDWFIHTDADELRDSPWAERNLAEGIAAVDRLGYNAIDFEVFQFPPARDGFRKEDPLRDFFRYWEPAGTFDRVQIKCWKKNDAIDLVSTGGHEARFPLQRVFPVRFILRHYPIRSQAHGERKVFTERKPRFVEAERHRNWHIQYDTIKEGHSFLRDAKDLRRFDAESARLQVWLNHRDGEALHEELRQVRGRAAEELSAQKVQLGERDRALGKLGGEVERMRQALDETHARLEGLLHSRTWRWSAPARLAWRMAKVRSK